MVIKVNPLALANIDEGRLVFGLGFGPGVGVELGLVLGLETHSLRTFCVQQGSSGDSLAAMGSNRLVGIWPSRGTAIP